MNKWFLALPIGVVILTALATSYQVATIDERARREFATSLYGSVENLEVIEGAESATAIRMLAPQNPGDPDHLWGARVREMRYYTAGAAVPLAGAQLGTIKRLLGRADLALVPGRKSCLPDHGVRFGFHRAGREVAVNFCLRCDLMLTTVKDEALGGANSDPLHGEITRLVKSLFVADLRSKQQSDRHKSESNARQTGCADAVKDGRDLLATPRSPY